MSERMATTEEFLQQLAKDGKLFLEVADQGEGDDVVHPNNFTFKRASWTKKKRSQ